MQLFRICISHDKHVFPRTNIYISQNKYTCFSGQFSPRTTYVCINQRHLFLQDDSFDAVLSIAVIHHIATTERRVRALRELARVSLDDDDCDDVNIDYFKQIVPVFKLIQIGTIWSRNFFQHRGWSSSPNSLRGIHPSIHSTPLSFFAPSPIKPSPQCSKHVAIIRHICHCVSTMHYAGLSSESTVSTVNSVGSVTVTAV